jgi:hypothetical protein
VTPMPKPTKVNPMPRADVCPAHMVRAVVTKYDPRRGSGQAIIKSTGRKVRVPWSALKEAHCVVLSPGDTIYIALDGFDKGRAEAIFVPGA